MHGAYITTMKIVVDSYLQSHLDWLVYIRCDSITEALELHLLI